MNRKDINTTPLISVIIPCYNSTELRRTLESVCRQSYPAWEVLCVDDGSELDLQPVVASLDDSRIHYHRLARHTNANVARNYGIRQSRGAYIAMLDSDDEWLPDHLKNNWELLETTGADGIYGCPMLKRASGQIQSPPVRERREEEKMANYLLSTTIGAQTSTLFMTAQSAKAVGWDETLRRHQDYDFVVRYDRSFRWVRNRRPTVVYTLPERQGHIDFASCIRFIDMYREEIEPSVYTAYHRNMWMLARNQQAAKEVIAHYEREMQRYGKAPGYPANIRRRIAAVKEKSRLPYDESFLVNVWQTDRAVMTLDLSRLPVGLKTGRMGICLYFYYMASLFHDESYHRYADRLLQGVYASTGTVSSISLEHGLAGIAWCILHFHEKKFVTGSLDVALHEVDNVLYRTIHFEWLANGNPSRGELLGLLFYYAYRLPTVRNRTERLLMEKTVVALLNHLEDTLPITHYKPSKDFNLSRSELSLYLFVLGRIYRIGLYKHKITKIWEGLSDVVLSLFPLLHADRLLLAYAMRQVLQCTALPGWEEHTRLLRSGIDLDRILDKEFLNKNVTLGRGVAGFALLLLQLGDEPWGEEAKARIIRKIETSDIWRERFDPTSPSWAGNIDLFNGCTGVFLLYQYLLMH